MSEMPKVCSAASARQRGVALAIVVWFLAGMSLLVAGIVMSARTDVRLAQVHLARAQVTAAGDGAINLLMADVLENRLDRSGAVLVQRRYRVGDDMVAVHAVPRNTLVNVLAASPAELAGAIRVSGAAQDGDSAGLVRAVVQYRNSQSRSRRIESIEDLLAVPGLNRAALDSLRDFITVERGAPGNRASAPLADSLLSQKLTLLSNWAPAARAGQAELLANSEVSSGAQVLLRGSSDYRVDALVRRDRDVWLRRRWVSVDRGGRGGLPWSFVRTEPVRLVPRAPVQRSLDQ